MDVFFEIHSDNPREGPGSFESTKRAFDSLIELPAKPMILDVGCGPGKQAFDLLKLSDANIIAIDNHQPYLNSIQQNIDKDHLAKRLKISNMNMAKIDFDKEHFDVIWSEGAIYNIGFENGLFKWKKFLKPSGYIAVTEASWLQENPPQDLRDFWINAYPVMQSVPENLKIIKKCGYKIIDYFSLPEYAWWEYYNPIINKLPFLKQKYAEGKKALAIIEEEETEIELYRKYSKYYGYVFYIMQKL